MATAIQQSSSTTTTTRTTRSGTRVVTNSNSSSSLRSAARTPVQRDAAKPRVPVPRDARASPVRPEPRYSPQRDPRSRTPVLREPRSKRDLAAVAAAAAAATAAAAISAPPTPPPHAPTRSTLPVAGNGIGNGSGGAASISGLRTPSPSPPLDGMLEGRAPLSIFVTNIRLLKLNLLEGFPNITINTFVPPGPGTVGQKRRIQCAEWVLFHLFSIWDPEETESKLRPFFPAQDADQSVELRAALFKSLERAKKMGALSRDALVRKSALEDCKADRLEDILASFSTTVLKKVVLEKLINTNARPDAILSYATQNSLGHRADRSELTAMTLAYRSSIRKMLQQKEAAKDRYREFSSLLATKEQDAARRSEAVLSREIEGHGKPVSDNARAEMRNTLRSNWSGNEAWMEALLGGESGDAGLMAAPFDHVWHKLQRGRLTEVEAGADAEGAEGVGLLQQLEGRVRVQKERLQKWNAFRRDTFGRSQSSQAPAHARTARTKLRGIDLGFENHMNLQVGKMARLSLKSRGVREPGMSIDYAAIVTGLNQDLARISKKDIDLSKLLAEYLPKKQQQQQQDKMHRRHHRSTSSLGGDDAASEISDLDDAEKTFSTEVHQTTSFPDRLTGGSCRSSLRPKLSRPDLTSIAVEGSSGPAIPLGKLNFPGKSAYDIDQFDIPEAHLPPPQEEAKPVTTPPSKRRTMPASPRDLKGAGSPPSKRRSTPSTPARESSMRLTTTPPSRSSRRPRKLDMNLFTAPVLQDPMTVSPTHYYADDDAPVPAAHPVCVTGPPPAGVSAGSPSSPAKHASPAPIRRTKPRHTLSVQDRKQLSLSRKSSFFLEDDEPDLVHDPASACGSTAEHTAEEDSKESSGEMTDDHSLSSARIPGSTSSSRSSGSTTSSHNSSVSSSSSSSSSGGAKSGGNNNNNNNNNHNSKSSWSPAPLRPNPPHQLRRSGRRAMTLPQKPSDYPSFSDVAASVAMDAEECGERLLERLALEQDYEAVFRSRPKIAQTSSVRGYGLSDYFG